MGRSSCSSSQATAHCSAPPDRPRETVELPPLPGGLPERGLALPVAGGCGCTLAAGTLARLLAMKDSRGSEVRLWWGSGGTGGRAGLA